MIFWRLFYIPIFVGLTCIEVIRFCIWWCWIPFSLILFGRYPNDFFKSVGTYICDFLFDNYWNIGDNIASDINEKKIDLSVLFTTNFWK